MRKGWQICEASLEGNRYEQTKTVHGCFGPNPRRMARGIRIAVAQVARMGHPSIAKAVMIGSGMSVKQLKETASSRTIWHRSRRSCASPSGALHEVVVFPCVER